MDCITFGRIHNNKFIQANYIQAMWSLFIIQISQCKIWVLCCVDWLNNDNINFKNNGKCTWNSIVTNEWHFVWGAKSRRICLNASLPEGLSCRICVSSEVWSMNIISLFIICTNTRLIIVCKTQMSYARGVKRQLHAWDVK